MLITSTVLKAIKRVTNSLCSFMGQTISLLLFTDDLTGRANNRISVTVMTASI
jgi:hypothetical protein